MYVDDINRNFDRKSEVIRLKLFTELENCFNKFIESNELENHQDFYHAYKCAATDFLGFLLLKSIGDNEKEYEEQAKLPYIQLMDLFELNFRE